MTSTLAAPPAPPPAAVAPATAPPATAAPAVRPRLRRVAYEPEPGTGDGPPLPIRFPQRPPAAATTAAEQVEVRHTAARVLRLALEVLEGRRCATHLAGHLEPAALRYWRAATDQRRVRTAARFSRMRVCLPRSGAAEVAVTCEIDGRPRALAARFERSRPGWRCTALRLG